MHIGNRIKKLRESLGIKRKDFASGVISYSHLSNIEVGKNGASEEILIAIAKKLNVPKEYLTRYKDIDHDLETKLSSLKANLDLKNLDEAESILENIKKDYPYINSIDQEALYYLLESYYYFRTNNHKDFAIIYEKELLPLLEIVEIDRIPSELFKETYYYLNAVNHFTNKQYEDSYQCFLKQLPLVKDPIIKAGTNYNIALSLAKLNKTNLAIPYANNALDVYLHENKWTNAAENYTLLGGLYIEERDFASAEQNLQKALDLAENFNNEKLKGKIYHNLGIVYKNLKKLNKSMDYFLKSLELNKATNNELFITYESIMEIYLEQNSLDDLTNILKEAKQYCNKEEDAYHFKIIEAKLLLKQNQLAEYELLMKEAIEYYYKNKMWKHLLPISEELGNFYKESKKYKPASQYYKIALDAVSDLYK